MSPTPFYSVALAALIALAALSGCQSEASSLPEQGSAGAPVDVLHLNGTTFVDTFEVLGTAEPLESVQVSAEVPGLILRAFAEEGEEIQRNQRLFQIDVEVDQAGIDVLETQLDAARRELRRMEALRAEGLATSQQLDNARTEVASLESNLRQSRLGVSRDQVRSPIAGFLSQRMADPGEYASPGNPLAEIIAYDTIVVHALVPESELRYVEGQENVEVYFPALEESFRGDVHRIALRVSGTTRNFPVEIRIDNQDRRLRPGMRARLQFERLTYEDVVVIPRDAVLEGFRGREAMVVENGRARVRTITLGPESRENVVVTAGLQSGDTVILRGHRGLVDEASVDIITEATQQEEDGL